MRIKEIKGFIAPDERVKVVIRDEFSSDEGTADTMIDLYGNYVIEKIAAVYEVVQQSPRLRITVTTPARRGRRRKESSENDG